MLRRALPGLLGLVVSLAVLRWALGDVQLSDLWRQIAGAHPFPLVAAVVLATATFPLRLLRWRHLLHDQHGQPLPALPLWHAIAIGFMANNILPLRAGELVRCVTAARLTRARLSAVVSSVAVERILDGLAVVALLSLALVAADLPADVTVGNVRVARVAQATGAAGLAALLAAGLLVAFPLGAERTVRRILPAGRLADRLLGFLAGVRHGLAALRSPTRLAWVVVWSFALWLLNAAAFWICFAAFDIPVGFEGALLLQGLLVLGISIPSTPGFIGPFEAAIVAALALFEVPANRAFSYAITFHVTTFVPIVLLGLWSLGRTPIALKDLRVPAA